MNKLWLLGIGALALVGLCQPAKAQSVPVFGVTTCGTPPTTITNGKPAYLTVLVGSGVLCTNSSGGGGGGTSSNFNAAFPTAGTAIGFSNGTNMVPGLVDTNGYLEVNVKTGGGGSATDNTSFTYGASPMVPVGGVYNSSITPLTSGDQGAVALTAARAMNIDAVTGSNLATLAAAPVPCQAQATWATSTGLTGTQATRCDGSAALWMDWGAVGGSAFSLGQQLAAASLPVVLPAAQITTLTPPSNTGYATSANQIVGTNYGNQANWLQGTSGNVTGTAQTTIITAPASGKLYVTNVQCFNSGSTSSVVTLNDGASTPLYNPAGTGVVASFLTPLVVGTTTALKFTPGSSSTNQWCNAQAYNAT